MTSAPPAHRTQIVACFDRSFALTPDGAVLAWGENSHATLGVGSGLPAAVQKLDPGSLSLGGTL